MQYGEGWGAREVAAMVGSGAVAAGAGRRGGEGGRGESISGRRAARRGDGRDGGAVGGRDGEGGRGWMGGDGHIGHGSPRG